MTASNFDRAVERVLRHEGGYADHPRDPGGATNMGITIATLAAWRGRAVSKDEVRALTRSEARTIYRKRYWDAVRGDDLPAGLDYAVFDAGVNSGPRRAILWLQRAVLTSADGIIGPLTLEAARRVGANLAVRRLCADRLAFLKSLATWPTFGAGWGRRVADVEAEALAMARDGGPVDPSKETKMEDTKAWYLSRGVWGSLISFAAVTASLFGLSIGASEQALLAELVPQVLAAGGALVALAGRIWARKRIG